MRRQDDDGAGGGQAPQPVGDDLRGASSRPVNGSSMQHQPRLVQQRALEREPLAHAAREPRHLVVGAIGEAGGGQRAIDRVRARRDRDSCAKNVEVLPGGELGIEVKLVREQADALAQLSAERARPAGPP